MGITGRYDGVYSSYSAACDQLTLSNDAFSGNYQQDVSVYGQQVAVQDSTFSSTASYTIDVYGANAVIDSNTVQNVPQYGISLSSTGGGQVTNNVFCDAGVGLSISGSGTPVQVAGNTVYCPTPSGGTGITAGGSVLVGPATISGVAYGPNTVYGYTSGTGIAVYGGATATRNVVYGNSTGIVLGNGFDSSATASDNRVYETVRAASLPTARPRCWGIRSTVMAWASWPMV